MTDMWKLILAANQASEGSDEQLKAAAEKIAHQPEDGPTSGNGKKTEGLIDEQVGKTEMDAKAILHTKAMEMAGKQLEGNTWDDPREAANARNLGTSAGSTPKAPLDTNRHNTQPQNKNLPRPVHRTDNKVKIATSKRASGLVDAAGKAISSSKSSRARAFVSKHRGAFGAGAAGAAGGFAAGRMSKKASYTLADHLAVILEGEAAVKTASEKVPPHEWLGAEKQARYAQTMGHDIFLGVYAEAQGIGA